MSPTVTSKFTALALCCGALSGCATGEGNQQLLGAGLGTALGCGIGYAIGGDAGCAIGGALGAATGWAVVAQYQATQVRSAAQDQAIYGLGEPVTATKVQIQKATSSPSNVRPGDTVQVSTDYSLMMPPAIAVQQADVQESWALKKDGKVLVNLPPQVTPRRAAGWEARAQIPIPENATSGTYVVEHKVQVGTSYDTDDSVFVVGSAPTVESYGDPRAQYISADQAECRQLALQASGGTTHGGVRSEQDFQSAYGTCMRGRGHTY
ncbi:MAG: hypothetical protein ACREXW_12440 [Gammaproteobacteria bacterium]